MVRPARCLFTVLATFMLVLGGCGKPEVELVNGGNASWAQWHGKWLVINYWAEWCAPCRREIPELNRFYHDSEDKGVMVLGVNFDQVRGDDLKKLIREMDIEFPVMLNDPGSRWDQKPPTVLPSTFVIDPDGKLVQVLVGPQTYESLSRAVHMTEQV